MPGILFLTFLDLWKLVLSCVVILFSTKIHSTSDIIFHNSLWHISSMMKLENWRAWELTRPCNNLFQTAVHKYIFFIAPHPILSEIKHMPVLGIPHVFLLGTLTRSHISKVILLNASWSEISFVFQINRVNTFGECLLAKTFHC